MSLMVTRNLRARERPAGSCSRGDPEQVGEAERLAGALQRMGQRRTS